MTTPLWLHLARIGEECPQATEASFSALQRAKWERVAAYVFGMYRTPLSASGTSELASDQAYCDALLDESIRGAYKGRTGGKDYYEQGEAGGIGGDVGKQSEAKLSDPASPSLPPWPKSYDSPDEGEFYDPTDVEPWRDAALAEIERLRQRAEKAEFSARQFCGEHIGVKWSRCPACSYFAYSRRAATLERDLVEAKRDSMLWHHRYTKETEVLAERERLERALADAKQENASLGTRLFAAQMNTSAGTGVTPGGVSVASTEDMLGSPADVPSPASVVDAPSAQRAFDAWRKWAHQSSAIASIGQEELDSRWWGDVARAIEEYEPEHDAQYMRYHRGRALAFIAGYLTARGVS